MWIHLSGPIGSSLSFAPSLCAPCDDPAGVQLWLAVTVLRGQHALAESCPLKPSQTFHMHAQTHFLSLAHTYPCSLGISAFLKAGFLGLDTLAVS